MGDFLDEYGQVILYALVGVVALAVFGGIITFFTTYGPEFINSLA